MLPPVSLILDLLASGLSSEEILSDYPGLDEADLRACIAYGAPNPLISCSGVRPMSFATWRKRAGEMSRLP
jgi:uncharacterized protein (DUF433 family)